MSDPTARTQTQRWRDAVLHRGPGYDRTPFWAHAVTGDLYAARACRAAAVAVVVASVWLAMVHQWLASGLVLWMVPSLLLVAGQAHRAHTRRTEGRT